VLPAATTIDDARLRADRDYQIAAAYFYATQYDEARAASVPSQATACLRGARARAISRHAP
jgi:hypothetical protein